MMSLRTVWAGVLIIGALICGYLFLAGFEYPGVTAWKIVTGSLGVLLFVLALVVARGRVKR